ncbi:MAG TPA: hypothetical protein VJ204_09365 [Solirubrobacterales bacterium]|nr:hypothetical protein [Solirubrobacterales bacterium]
MPIRVSHLDASDVARMKLGARGISVEEARQLPHNRHQLEPNPRAPKGDEHRSLLIGRTDGGRILTLVVEPTSDPISWVIVTGWTASPRERKVVA